MDKFYRKEMAEWLGIAQNSLIYLENKKFIPTYRQKNGYRYYRGDSVARLLLYRYLRSYGYGIDEAIDLFFSPNNEDVLQKLRSREAELEAELQQTKRKLQILRQNMTALPLIPENTLELTPCTMPELYLLPGGISDVQRQWIDQMPVVRPFFLIPLEERPWLDLDFGYGVFRSDLECTDLSLDLQDSTLFYPGKTVLHGYFPMLANEKDSPRLLSWLSSHQIQRVGPILCSMTEKICYNSGAHILEVWIPVES